MALVYSCQSKLSILPAVSTRILNSCRLGIEGLVMFKRDMQFDAENYTITVGETTIAVFDKVTVRIEVEKDRNTQRGRVKMSLVHPIDSSGM